MSGCLRLGGKSGHWIRWQLAAHVPHPSVAQTKSTLAF